MKPSQFLRLATAGVSLISGSDAIAADQTPAVPIPTVQLLNEFRPIGGGGNNLVHPDYDPIPGDGELALVPLHFAPGTTDGLVEAPNARTISNVISGGTGANGQNSETLDPVYSAWLYVFGQFIAHDTDLEVTPEDSEAINITVPPGDPVFQAGTVIPMTRDTRDPLTNTIVNGLAGYLDLSELYGSTQAQADSLRNADGTLVSSNNGQDLPIGSNGRFVTGDPRANENPELSAVTILFMREHNFWVRTLKAQHPGWTGDQLYAMAKEITTAEYQNIIYKQFLPALIGPVLGPYKGYDPNVKAQATQEFTTAAFRAGHSQVAGTQHGYDNNGNLVFTESLYDASFNSAVQDIANGIDPTLRSLSVDYGLNTDVYVVSPLRNLLFSTLPGGDVDEIDLIAIDIQRGKDVGLGTLNETRTALGMQPYKSFSELTSDPVLQQNFASVYRDINHVDLFMGGLAEAHVPGTVLGPTFEVITAYQFYCLRAGDRFFWQNESFDAKTAAMISNTTLTDLMKRDTDTTAHLQSNLFLEAPLNGKAPPHPQPHFPLSRLGDAAQLLGQRE